MYSRLISCTIQPGKVDEFRDAINNEFLPRIQQQKGFVENVESCDPATGRFSCMTLWNTEEDVHNYERGLFQEISGRIAPLMASNPMIEDMPVENASAHGLHAGRVAAAA